VDYLFPDDQASQSSFKLLEMAKKWKENMEKQGSKQ
jgi:hypothetical protein